MINAVQGHVVRRRPLALRLGLGVMLAMGMGLAPRIPAAHALTGTVRYVAPGGNDSNDCRNLSTPCKTIQGAINQSSSGDSIVVEAGTYAERVTITANLTISGAAGAGQTVVDGGGLGSVVTVPSGSTVSLLGLTLRNGSAGQGGGITNNGNLTLTDSTVANNTATASGGGIYNNGTLTLQGNTAVVNNTAPDGGGIANDNGSTLTLTPTVSAAPPTSSSTVLSTTTPLTDLVKVMSNTASLGGGIANDTGSTLQLVGSIVSNNTASSGGGVYNADGSTALLSGSTVDHNSATAGSGGGVDNVAASTVTLSDSSVRYNTSSSDGGGIYSANNGDVEMDGTVVGDNSAGQRGGGIYNSVGYVRLGNSTVSLNRTFGAGGGGIYDDARGTLNLGNSTVSGNSAAASGGGVDIAAAATATLANTILAGNTTAGATGPDCNGVLASSGYNLLGSTAGCAFSTTTGDQTGVDPRLGPLQDNGGPTLTQALLPDSPAIDQGNPNGCADGQGPPVTTDQRGGPRPFPAGGRCDIGAYEYQPVVSGVSPNSGPTTGGTQVVITGIDLEGVTGVSFGGVAATNIVADASGTFVVATTPMTAGPGTVDVQVSVMAGRSIFISTIVPADQFTYVAPPTTGTATSLPTSTTTAPAATALPTSTTPAPSASTATTTATPPSGSGTASAATGTSTATPAATGTAPTASTATGTATGGPPAPHIVLNPTTARPGTLVTVTGSGFGAREQITLALNSAALATAPAVIMTTANGTFTAAFRAPSSLLNGPNTVSAIGNRSHLMAVATLTGVLPVAARFFFAGGMNTASEHSSVQLLNPNARPAQVHLTFYFANGATDARTVTIAPTALRMIAVAGLERRRGAFGLAIAANRQIAAALDLTRPGLDGDSILGNTGLSTTWYLAEGYTGLTFHESVSILNPDPTRSARVRLQLLPFGGRRGRTVTVRVPAHTDTTVNINPLLPRLSLSVVANADRPIVVERTLTFSKIGRGTGYGLTARAGINVAAASWLLAEGTTVNRFQTFLTILNPGDRPTRVTALFFGSSGGILARRSVVMAARSRANIKLNDFLHASGVASLVMSSRPIVVERPEYFGSPNGVRIAGSDVFGRNGAAPRWSFPDGETQGQSEFLLFYNPSSTTVPVLVSLYGTDGRVLTRRIYLPPSVRYTLDVKRVFGAGASNHGATAQSLNGQSFVAEQTIFAPNHTTLRGTQGLAQ